MPRIRPVCVRRRHPRPVPEGAGILPDQGPASGCRGGVLHAVLHAIAVMRNVGACRIPGVIRGRGPLQMLGNHPMYKYGNARRRA
ncbi:hypothetical protein IBTHAUMO2_1010011 [Nitrosopumilaceae archaeon]|nr:hypothetical protein IBTHAUMO2_1010011 [Nitrosopumilaceae archaeon]